jgi:sulfofructose kinase
MKLEFTFPTGKAFDVVGLGLNAVDHLCVVPQFPQFDSKLKMVDFSVQGGGQAATAMVACKRLGLKTRYMGKFGDDEFGRFSAHCLEQEGVATHGAIRVPGVRNQFAFILIDQETGERTIIWDRDKRLSIKPEEISRDIICSAKVLLIDGHDAAAGLQAARWAKEDGMVVVMDAEKISDETKELMNHVDICIGERHFPERFTGIADLRQGLDAITSQGPRIAGVTLGKDGALVLYRGTVYHSPAYSIECRDTTGAGDVFHAAFIRALHEDWDIMQCLDFSNAVAALKCRGLGGRAALPSFAEAVQFMEQGERAK